MNENKQNLKNLLELVWKAIGLAMSVAVIVLNYFGAESKTLTMMIAIGMFCLAMAAISDTK